MKHSIDDTYRDGYVKVAFCVFCSCENIVELLDGNCPGEFKIAKKQQETIDKVNAKV